MEPVLGFAAERVTRRSVQTTAAPARRDGTGLGRTPLGPGQPGTTINYH